ncbi:hypothetical protein [Candidatus Endomicrobiellum agilis]|nr:hypothetical protein [Endomicrobium sp.]
MKKLTCYCLMLCLTVFCFVGCKDKKTDDAAKTGTGSAGAQPQQNANQGK